MRRSKRRTRYILIPGCPHPRNTCSKAAQYLRMSSEHQQYSPLNQVEAIAAYATLNQIEVIQTYADLGRSGLSLAGRAGYEVCSMTSLMRDTTSQSCSSTTSAVGDVSKMLTRAPTMSSPSRRPVLRFTIVPSSSSMTEAFLRLSSRRSSERWQPSIVGNCREKRGPVRVESSSLDFAEAVQPDSGFGDYLSIKTGSPKACLRLWNTRACRVTG